jgi:hypothetical protein
LATLRTERAYSPLRVGDVASPTSRRPTPRAPAAVGGAEPAGCHGIDTRQHPPVRAGGFWLIRIVVALVVVATSLLPAAHSRLPTLEDSMTVADLITLLGSFPADAPAGILSVAQSGLILDVDTAPVFTVEQTIADDGTVQNV